MQSGSAYIELDRVEVHYNEFVSGLRGVSLNIQQGEFVFLVGQTGSGKSTLLKILTRQVKASAGKARIGTRDLVQMPDDEVPFLRREMGIVPQDFGLLPNKKVWENVAYAMRAVGKSKRDVRHDVPKILDRVNLLHRPDAYPHQLSGGEQQRVAIARALINDPPLLLADEPTGNLDPAHSKEIIELLLELNAKGTTVVVATHDMEVVKLAERRVVQMAFGLIEADNESFVPGGVTEPAPETQATSDTPETPDSDATEAPADPESAPSSETSVAESEAEAPAEEPRV
jgi:cell division transport system ATP-binding protein